MLLVEDCLPFKWGTVSGPKAGDHRFAMKDIDDDTLTPLELQADEFAVDPRRWSSFVEKFEPLQLRALGALQPSLRRALQSSVAMRQLQAQVTPSPAGCAAPGTG